MNIDKRQSIGEIIYELINTRYSLCMVWTVFLFLNIYESAVFNRRWILENIKTYEINDFAILRTVQMALSAKIDLRFIKKKNDLENK